MVTVKVKIQPFLQALGEQLAKLQDNDYLLRPVCFDMISLMKNRIHKQGLASDDSPIGTYNKQYLKLRVTKYSRTADPTIIVSLTRQLENDWSVIATPTGYAIGFKNILNYNKARWVEARKDKKIFDLSEEEKQTAIDEINDLVTKAFQS